MRFVLFILLFLALEITDGFQGVFWHICDIHLNLSHNSLTNGRFGNYKSDAPLTLIDSAFQNMKRIYPNPDFIILNGDNVFHSKLNDMEFKNSLSNVSYILHNTFPNANILPSLGNHDVNPANIYSIDSNWCQSLFLHWKPFFRNSTSSETKSFKKGCYFSRTIKSHNTEVNIIVLNTILWYAVNKIQENLNDPLGQFQWLMDELSKSRKSHTRVFIVGHVPPGASEFSPYNYKHLHPQFNKQLLNILQEYSDIIDAGFFSHQHTDAFKIVYDNNKIPAVPLFLSPSISPYHLNGLGSVNPSFRLYFWNNTVETRSYKQYHTKLYDSQATTLNWSLEYISTSLLLGLSADYLNNLTLDFLKDDSNYFDKFFNYHLSGQSHDNNDCSVNSTCRCNIICGIQNIDYTNLDSCLRKCPQKPTSQWVMIASVIIIFTIILIGIVIGANKVYCRGHRTASLTRDIYLAPFNGKNCEEIMSEHIDNIAENTFGDVPEYRGHIRNNSRTILTLNDGNEIVEKSQPSISRFALQSKNKSQEKYDYTRM